MFWRGVQFVEKTVHLQDVKDERNNTWCITNVISVYCCFIFNKMFVQHSNTCSFTFTEQVSRTRRYYPRQPKNCSPTHVAIKRTKVFLTNDTELKSKRLLRANETNKNG